MAQLERETSYDSSEPTSMTNSSTQEGELTIQHEEKDDGGVNEMREEEEEEDRTLATTPEGELEGIRPPGEDGLVDDMLILRKKLEEVR